ncbi:MAG: tryptophan synthase subunit alpha [Phycisphaerales bacterium]|nr:tryptophan synthase subunit alpha [Phycisphaerales bacterium]MCB9836331.1 tryptophan synthase subunit alpha [Phycisphaera sp.]
MIAHAPNRIESIFAELRANGKRALMPFVVGGHPDANGLAALLETIDAAGASVIEVGFPFSDPVADGPVIAEAMHKALQLGVTPRSVLEQVKASRGKVRAGLVAMISASLVHRMGGPVEFAQRAADAGIDGCIFPDVTLEEAGPYVEACRSAGLCVSLLVAPTTPMDRARRIVQHCSGFVYVIARAGITGESGGLPEIKSRIAELRSITDLPLAVGFGISTPEQVRMVTQHADAAIVGSALVRRIAAAAESGQSAIDAAREMVFTLAQGIGSD